jgi:hypothetical protein
MGQINLFASKLTPTVSSFLRDYMDGDLQVVGMIRALEEKEFPHSNIVVAKLQYSYVIVEVADPISYNDISWLYRAIMTGEFPCDTPAAVEEFRVAAMKHSIERCLNVGQVKSPRRKVENEDEWRRIREFRKLLEVPVLALKHLNQTNDKAGHCRVDRTQDVLVIEYDAIHTPSRNKRHG